MKIFGKIPIAWAAAVSALIFSLALGLLSWHYYRQQASSVQFFSSEAKGLTEALQLLSRLIELATEPAPAASELPSLSAEAKALVAKIRQVIDHSNLILDPGFQSYYLVEATFSWMPLLFQYRIPLNQTQTEDPTFSVRQLALERMKASFEKVFKASGLSLDQDFFSDDEQILATNNLLQAQGGLLIASRPTPRNLAQLRESSLLLASQSSHLFNRINDLRIQAAQRAAKWLLAFSMLLWAFSLILVFFIVRSALFANTVMENVISDQRTALEKAKKLSTLGEISGSIGHDIANPLTVILNTTYTLEQLCQTQGVDWLKYTDRIRKMVKRIEAIVSSMRAFLGQSQTDEIDNVDLSQVFEEVRLLMNHKLMLTKTDLVFDLGSSNLWAQGSEAEYVQVFVNLVNNAVDAVKTTDLRVVTVEVEHQEEFLLVSVKDTGCGVPADIREKIFEPFFTLKKTHEGTGLGLSICRKIVTKFGGSMKCVECDRGACFHVSLPVPSN